MRSHHQPARLTQLLCASFVLLGIAPSLLFFARSPHTPSSPLAPFLISRMFFPSPHPLHSFESLPDLIPSLPLSRSFDWRSKDWHVAQDAWELTALLFEAEQSVAYSHIPPRMRHKLLAAGRDPSLFEKQQCITIGSRFLPWEALSFNRVRSLRFAGAPVPRAPEGRSKPERGDGVASGRKEREREDNMEVGHVRQAELSALLDQQSCQPPDLCDPINWTMADVHIGHLHNEQAIAFANMGRVTALHGVVVARRVTKWSIHSPSWGCKATFPTLSFDSLRNGGASMLHPHLQTRVGRTRYAGKWEGIRQAAARYTEVTGRSFHQDVASAHAHLGLLFARSDHFVAHVSLTSSGAAVQIEILGDTMEEELSTAPRATALATELGRIFFKVLRAAHAELNWDGFSASCAFPPLEKKIHDANNPGSGGMRFEMSESERILSSANIGLPSICRLVGRGSYDSRVSDISANELFEIPVVSTCD
ncbi:MAG: hypothetical protein SGPRY_011852 [Prymnesium sp.]